MKWDRNADTFSFKVKLKDTEKLTKRTILSEIATIFDPLGFAAPVIIKAKMLLQELWLIGLAWDDPVPPTVQEDYTNLRTQLHLLEEIHLPRWIHSKKDSEMELHGFCDASEKKRLMPPPYI